MCSSSILSSIIGISYITSIALAALIAPPQSIEDQSSPYDASVSVNIPNILSDVATTSPNSSATNDKQVICDGHTFGTSLNIISCRTAWHEISLDDGQMSFGMRYGPRAAQSDIKLPYEWLSLDGFCSIQVFLIEPALEARTSFLEISKAAESVYHDCVLSSQPTGGIATNIGGDNKLAVVIQASGNRNVQCLARRAPLLPACRAVVNSIFASLQRQLFGLRINPRVQVVLPAIFRDASESCWATVKTPTGRPDYSSWYEMWKAVSAIYWMCVEGLGLVGKATLLGEIGNLELTLSGYAASGS